MLRFRRMPPLSDTLCDSRVVSSESSVLLQQSQERSPAPFDVVEPDSLPELITVGHALSWIATESASKTEHLSSPLRKTCPGAFRKSLSSRLDTHRDHRSAMVQ